VTIGTGAGAAFAILTEADRQLFTIQEARTSPLEIAYREMQKNPCATSKLSIVL
jgi:hypothetical protein